MGAETWVRLTPKAERIRRHLEGVLAQHADWSHAEVIAALLWLVVEECEDAPFAAPERPLALSINEWLGILHKVGAVESQVVAAGSQRPT